MAHDISRNDVDDDDDVDVELSLSILVLCLRTNMCNSNEGVEIVH